MGVNSLPKTVTRQRSECDLNRGPSAPESSTLITRDEAMHTAMFARASAYKQKRLLYPAAVGGGGIKRYRDPSVCLSRDAVAPGYRHAGCLQLSRERTADPSADGRTHSTCISVASRNELPSTGAYRLAAPGAKPCLTQSA